MVQNGYVLNVSTAGLPAFLQRVRNELKTVTRECVLSQVAKAAEMLYDMKFIEGRKYETSIFEQAVGMVAVEYRELPWEHFEMTDLTSVQISSSQRLETMTNSSMFS